MGIPPASQSAARSYELTPEGVLTPVWGIRSSVLDPPPGHDVAEIGERYLRLAELHVDDESAIVGFCSAFGTLGVRHEDFEAFRAFPDFARRVRPRLMKAWPQKHTDVGLASTESMEDFRFGAQCIRDLVTALRLLRGDIASAQWVALPSGSSWLPRYDEYEDLSPADRQWHEAGTAVELLANRALMWFAPRLLALPAAWVPTTVAESKEDRDNALKAVTLIGSVGPLPLPLYAVCCAEAFNHAVSALPYRTCARPSCARVFIRQEGRSKKGRHRTAAVLYCSDACANAEAQSRHRERERAKREGLSALPRGESSE